MTTAGIPAAISAYYAAKNRKDIDGMLASFANGAVVKDEGKLHAGREEIRAWMEETTRKYGVSVEVLGVERDGARDIASARVSGNFPGSPVVLRYAFTLSGTDPDARIERLEIA